MDRIIMLNDDLESQMRMYLALCPRYRIDIAENEVSLMRLVRRKRPNLIVVDANHSRFHPDGKSAEKLISKIRNKYDWVRILGIVDSGDESFGHSLVTHGADDWIDRFIDTDELLDRVDRILDFRSPLSPGAARERTTAEV